VPNEEIGKLNVVVNLDSTGFQNGISQLNRQMKLVQSEFQAATAKLGDFGSSTDKLKLQADALSKQIEIQKQKVAALEQAYQRSVETKGADAKATQDLAIKLNKAQAELANLENELKKTTTELEKQSSVWYKLSQSAKEAGEKLKDVGKKVSDVGESLTKKVTAPILAAGTAAVKFSIDFENGMAKVATIADTSKVSLDSLRKGLLELSNQTGISVNELTEATYQAISAGVDTANSVKFLETAVKAAKGGFTDTTTAVNALSTVLNAYGLKASEAKRITDEMMVAQNYGKTTFGEMARSIGNVIPIASALNVSTKELFASLAVLTKNGIQTSEAVTGLKAAFSNIMKPSSEAAKLAEQLGLSFNAAHLQSVGWAKFLEEVREKTGGNAEMMAKLFGSVEALNTVTVLAGKGAQDFAQALTLMGNAAGTTDKAFVQVTNTTGAKLNKALNELKNSAIQFGDALAPMVQRLADILSMLADKFNALTPAQQQLIIQFAAVAAAIGPVILVVGKLITAVGTISTAFSTLSGAMAAAGGASGAVGAAISALTGPIGIAVAAIVGLTAVGVTLYKNWDTIKQKGIELKDNLITTFNNMKEKVINAWDSLRTAASDIFNKIKEAILAPFRNLHIPLPHVSVSWRSVGVGPLSITIPDFNVKWYATGGIFNSPAIIGVGEAGPEAVIPIEKLTYIIRDALMQIQPQQTVARPNEIHLHIGALIADDYSLKQLERKLMNIRILENNRLGVMGG
jgi:TP901 family phage tail tape measure protein